MSKAESFENECRQRFLGFCILYKMASYHSEKRKYVEAAYDQVDVFLDWRDLQSL